MNRDAAWLAGVFRAVDVVFFSERMRDDGVTARWARFRRVSKTFRAGSFWEDTRVIEISPVFKHEWVPMHVVVSVVFHECLHHVHAGVPGAWHSPAFKRDEQRDCHFALSDDWITQNQDRLVAARAPARS